MRQRNTSRKNTRTNFSEKSQPRKGKSKSSDKPERGERSSFKKEFKKVKPGSYSGEKRDYTASPRGERKSSSRPSSQDGEKRSSYKKGFKADRSDSSSSRRRLPPDVKSTTRDERRPSTFGNREDKDKRGSFKREFKKDRPDSFSKRESSDKREVRGGRSSSFDKDKRTPFKKEFKKDRRDSSSDERPPRYASRRTEEDKVEKRSVFTKGLNKDKADLPEKEGEAEAARAATIRLNKYISNSGVCSRREADNLIGMGLVSVNGKTITELGYKVNRKDVVRYEDKVLTAEKPVYVLMNKPKGYLTTTKDPQERKTVMHMIGDKVKERIYPVGRLDRNTTGLLLLTNDGDLADKLSHPSFKVKKIYKAELDKPLTAADFTKIKEGVRLEEGKAKVDDIAIVSADGKTIGIELHIGWNRVVRRIFEELGYAVVKLDRVIYAGLDKKELPRGEWRFLKKGEIVKLKYFK